MNGRTTAVGTLVAEVAAVAAMPGSPSARAEALLAPLAKLVTYDAAQITLLDPERRRQSALVRRGFPERIRQYMDGPTFVQDLELIGLHGARRPMRAKDMPVPDVPLWVHYLQPAGFGEGLGVPLVTDGGRYLGQLALLTETATPVSDDTCDALGQLAPLIALAVDPLRAVGALASLVNGAVAGVVLTRAGQTMPLPGLPDHRLLGSGGPVLDEAASCLDAGQTYGTFLAPDHPHGYLRARVLACPALPPGYLRAVVLLCPPGNLYTLSHQELRILGMLIGAWPPARIAADLCLTGKTLHMTLDDIGTKLDASSREVAVMRAAGQGLYLPPSMDVAISPTAEGSD